VPTAIYDLFRIENGKIAEHWDTLQVIPPRDQWKNSNGKF
jgi:predicted SnoaL-like aldol condensation-catalyzing enzyme